MLALAGDNREDAAAHMMARVAKDAEGHDEMALIMENPGVAAAEGLAAFGAAQYSTAFDKMRAAHPRFQMMGGSHAQRDVFERVTIEAGLRAGRLDATEALLRGRIAQRGGAIDAFADKRLRMIADAREIGATFAAE